MKVGHGKIDPRIPTFSYFAFLQNFWMTRFATLGVLLGVTWSLAIEEQFYLTLPAVIRFFDQRSMVGILVAGIIAAPAIRITLGHIWPQHLLGAYVLMPCRADSLLLGVLGAYIFRSKACKQLQDNRYPLWATVIVLLIGAVVLTLRFHNFTDPLMISAGYTWMSLLYLCLLFLVVSQPVGWLGAVMRWRWLRWLGSIAYGVYLVHQLVLELIFRLLWHSRELRLNIVSYACATILALLVTLVLCSLSWKYFERPLVQFGHRSPTRVPSPTTPMRTGES